MRTHEPTAFTRLLEDYCRSVGMGEFEIDPEGGEFVVEDVTVVVRHDEDFGRLAMAATVESVAPEQLEQLAAVLLQLNAALGLSGGLSFCADATSGALQLQQSVPLANIDSEQLDAELALIVTRCRSARELISTLNDGPAMARELLEKATQSNDASLVMFKL